MKSKEKKIRNFRKPIKTINVSIAILMIKRNELDSYYSKFELEKLNNISVAIRTLNIKGLNVTIPYKKKIIKYLYKFNKNAAVLQSVNTIHNKKGKLEGYNTDLQ